MAGKPSRKIKASKKASHRTASDSRAITGRVLSRRLPAATEADAGRGLDPAVREAAIRRAASIRKAGVRHQSLAKFLATPEARQGYVEGEAAQRAADLIREMRKQRGLSQAELARNMNVEASRIGELERGVGRYGPTLGKLEQVANACGFKLVVGFE
jgi:DNA-binding XRE family transcriptional regulator